jgi:uncharacterized membrane protein YgcG
VEAGKGAHLRALARGFRRIWGPFLTREEKARIVAAGAEQNSRATGKIHVLVVAHAGEMDILTLARRRFISLGLHKNSERNDVLILISWSDRRFAIWGDEAIHASVGQPLWERATETLTAHFASERYADGIVACVRDIGTELAKHFPRT